MLDQDDGDVGTSRVDVDQPTGLHEGYACANRTCPQTESYRTAMAEMHQGNVSVPIIGTRFECTVCRPADGQIHPNGMVGVTPRLSFCDQCMHEHDIAHPLTMYRVAPDSTSVIPTRTRRQQAESEQKHVVQAILDRRILHGVKEYLINWQGPYWHSWHTATSLQNATLIQDYEDAHTGRKSRNRNKKLRSSEHKALRIESEHKALRIDYVQDFASDEEMEEKGENALLGQMVNKEYNVAQASKQPPKRRKR